MDDNGFDYSHPDTDLRFGRGRRDEVGEVLANHGDDALVVTTRNAMQRAGFLDDVEASLSDAGVDTVVFDSVQPNPTVENVRDCVSAGDDADADAVLALGGGSVIDTAKTTAMCLATFGSTPDEDEIWEFCVGDRRVEEALPTVVIPSTSGTGSHIDPWAVVSDEPRRAKPGFGGAAMVPDDAVVDPEILDEMPAELAARTGFDAFCHLNEAYVATTADPMTDVFARRGIEIVADSLTDSVEGSPEARDEMAIADTLAGICETTSMTIVTHALAHSISAFYPSVAHGEALASVSSAVVEYNVENGDDRTKKRYGEVADLLGQPVADHKLDAPLAVDAFDSLKREIGLNPTVAELGVDDDEIGELVDNAREYMSFSVATNPVELGRDGMVEIVENAYQ